MKLNSDTIFEIGKFSILWSQFEKVKLGNDCNCRKIKKFADENKYKYKDFDSFSSVILKRSTLEYSCFNEYIESIIPPPKDNHRPRKNYVDIMKNFVKEDSRHRLAGMLLIIYRIRNNLLHGKKINLDEQIEMFKAINTVLEGILGELKCKN